MDRGTLARIDRRLLTEFDHSGGVQLVKVPASDAVWSTWKRYCEALGLTMGAGIAVLIEHELEMVVGAGPADAAARETCRRSGGRAGVSGAGTDVGETAA